MLQGPRLPSHATNCTGCGCVQWTLRVDGDRLESTVLMSPPAIHAKYVLTRTGPPAKPGHLALWARTQWRNGCAIGGNETIPNFPWVLPPPTPPPPPPPAMGVQGALTLGRAHLAAVCQQPAAACCRRLRWLMGPLQVG